MQSKATTVHDYLQELQPERLEAISTLRDLILKNLPEGYEEQMIYGMIGYVVPHSLFPQGYHCDPTKPLTYLALASQKNHMALYLSCFYGNEEIKKMIEDGFQKEGKKMNAGAGCLRFKKLSDLPLEVIIKAIAKVPVAKYVDTYQKVLAEQEAARKARKAKK